MLIILPTKHTLTSFLMRFLLAFQYSSKTTCDVGMTRMFHHKWLFQDHLLGNLDMKNHSQNQCRVISKKTAKHSAVCGMKSIPESFYYHSHSGPPQILCKRGRLQNKIKNNMLFKTFFVYWGYFSFWVHVFYVMLSLFSK